VFWRYFGLYAGHWPEIKRAEFEVASFKASPPAQGPTIVINGLGTFRGGRLTFTNASLNDLKYAYGMTSDAQLADRSGSRRRPYDSTSKRWRRWIPSAIGWL